MRPQGFFSLSHWLQLDLETRYFKGHRPPEQRTLRLDDHLMFVSTQQSNVAIKNHPFSSMISMISPLDPIRTSIEFRRCFLLPPSDRFYSNTAGESHAWGQGTGCVALVQFGALICFLLYWLVVDLPL